MICSRLLRFHVPHQSQMILSFWCLTWDKVLVSTLHWVPKVALTLHQRALKNFLSNLKSALWIMLNFYLNSQKLLKAHVWKFERLEKPLIGQFEVLKLIRTNVAISCPRSLGGPPLICTYFTPYLSLNGQVILEHKFLSNQVHFFLMKTMNIL